MKILNMGSLNIDKTYNVDHFVKPGETMSADSLTQFCGGKGLNQSIALAAAGADVTHFGCIGEDGEFLVDMMKKRGVKTDAIYRIDYTASGHAIIQVDKSGQNCIILFPGANREIKPEWIHKQLENYGDGDWILLQNETNCLDEIIRAAHKKGIKIAFNPSPMDERVLKLPIDMISLFLVNEGEGAALSGCDASDDILASLVKRFPNAAFLLTLGKDGSIFTDGKVTFRQKCYEAKVVDTTGAGDTYTGFFLSNYIKGEKIDKCMSIATMASTIQISKKGAATAIPTLEDVQNALAKL